MDIHELFEAPISDLTHVGDWTKGSSFRHATDRKLLTNPKAITKITAQWEKTPVDFNVYLVNNKDGIKYGEIGAVTKEWIDTKLPTTAPFIDVKPNAVNLLFMNNSGDERVPMTGWIMAHRFGHVVSRYNGQSGLQFSDFTDVREELLRVTASVLNDGFGFNYPGHEITPTRHLLLTLSNPRQAARDQKTMVSFYEQIGTMRSARTGQLRNEFEFTHELLAQYMLTGEIKFNPIPTSFKVGRSTVRLKYPDDLDYYNGMLDDLAESLGHMFLNLLNHCVGKILVM